MDERNPPGLDEALARVAELEEAIATLRHDLKGMLSPGMLMADTLVGHAEPKVARAGQVINAMIERMNRRLNETRAVVESRTASRER